MEARLRVENEKMRGVMAWLYEVIPFSVDMKDEYKVKVFNMLRDSLYGNKGDHDG